MSRGYSAWISRAREIEGIYPTEREICRNAHIYWYKLNGFIAKNPVKSTPIHWWTQHLSSFGHHCLSLQKPSVSLSCGKGMTIKPIYRWFGSIHSREGDSIAILNYQGEIQWNVPMKYPEWSKSPQTYIFNLLKLCPMACGKKHPGLQQLAIWWNQACCPWASWSNASLRRQRPHGAFLKWGYPNSWMVYNGKANWNGWWLGYLYFRNPPGHGLIAAHTHKEHFWRDEDL